VKIRRPRHYEIFCTKVRLVHINKDAEPVFRSEPIECPLCHVKFATREEFGQHVEEDCGPIAHRTRRNLYYATTYLLPNLYDHIVYEDPKV
jgi:hypothetical protein